MLLLLLVWAPMVWAPIAAAQPTPYERMLESHRMTMNRLAVQARALTNRAAAEMSSAADWEQVADQRRLEMREMLGLDPWPAKTPLNVQITGRIEMPGYVIEKIAFESLPKIYVTGNLYLPTEHEAPLPTVIYVCGHAYSPYGAKTVYQRHGHTLAKQGYAAFILDPIQIAETFALHHGLLNNEMYDWYARGYTPAGVEVWNVIRALDYLETRPEIDSKRFGITGRSGGAAMSWFSAAVDERLRVAAPVMGISTYAANVADNTQVLHCDCMFAVNNRLHDMLHQGALIAPRPLWMAHGRLDRLFPVPGYTEFERVIGGLYEAFGRGEAFRNTVVETAHKDSDFLRAESVRWFDQWLKEVPNRDIDVSFDEVPPEDLAVFGGSPPEDALNYRVHELFIPAPPEPRFQSAEQWERRRTELLATLRERVFGAFPVDARALTVLPGRDSAEGGFESIEILAESGVRVRTLYRAAPEPGGPALLWVASDGEDFVATRDTLRQIAGASKNAVMIVYPRGVGEVPWTKKRWKDMQRNAMHVGRTVDSMRLWDVLQAVKLLRGKSENAEVVVAGIGRSAGLSLYAGILDERISQVILFDPPTTHRAAPIFLDVLRYTDLPEAAALMAPRRVTFYGRVPEPYEATRKIFELLGEGGKLSLTMSLEGALNGRFHHRFPSGL